MRGSFDALAGAVRHLGLDPRWFDGSGWCVLAKLLEAGRPDDFTEIEDAAGDDALLDAGRAAAPETRLAREPAGTASGNLTGLGSRPAVRGVATRSAISPMRRWGRFSRCSPSPSAPSPPVTSSDVSS